MAPTQLPGGTFSLADDLTVTRFGYGATVSVAILVLSIAVAALLLGKVFRGAFDV